MAVYFVNANGSETSPFDTPAKGANTIEHLIDGVAVTLLSGDIIEVTDDAEIDDSGMLSFINIDVPIIVRGYVENTNKPIIKVSTATVLFGIDAAILVQGIRFYKTGSITTSVVFEIGTIANGCEISNCEFDGGGATDNHAIIQVVEAKNSKFTTAPKIIGNKFKNCKSAIDWKATQPG